MYTVEHLEQDISHMAGRSQPKQSNDDSKTE